MARYPEQLLQRALRLYRIPGVTAAEVCERLGVSRYALKKARKTFDRSRYAWPQDLMLSALTDTGLRTSGPWPTRAELATMASYCDFVNKDGCTADEVEHMLSELVDAGQLGRTPEGFVLRKPFP